MPSALRSDLCSSSGWPAPVTTSVQSGESSQADDAGTVAGVEGAVPMQSSFSLRTMQIGAAVVKEQHLPREKLEGKENMKSVSNCKPSRHLVARSSAEIHFFLSCRN